MYNTKTFIIEEEKKDIEGKEIFESGSKFSSDIDLWLNSFQKEFSIVGYQSYGGLLTITIKFI